MKRNNITDIPTQFRLKQHKECIAFHEAGHAAAIYLNNKAKNLPPVYFQIVFKELNDDKDHDVIIYQATHDDSIARVEGGRLIQSLPYSIDGLAHKLIDRNEAMTPLVRDYIIAFETDIINLLVGPLAEAKHAYNRDDEVFNHQLINLRALKNYGGGSDLALAREYLESFSVNRQQQEAKLDELFLDAFDFINDRANWKAITRLADYILKSNKNIIGCEEVVSLLES
ncbi:MAG: hypothetical protein PHD43_04330 [Methylococcales bacterium]|nr:hypothetical protein [Methylococcales bacterium]